MVFDVESSAASRGCKPEITLTGGVQVEYSDNGRGRICVATRDFARGDIALLSAPLAVCLFPSLWDERCSYCMAKSEPFRCTNCRTVVYCSKECQKLDWSTHRPECPHLQALLEQYPSSILHDMILTGRVSRLHAAAKPPRYQPYEPSISELQGDGSRNHNLALHGPTPSDFSVLHRVDCEAAKVANIVSMCFQDTQELCQVTREGIWEALLKFSCNNFAVVDDLCNPIASGCYPHGAMLNHSCAPNCVLTYNRRYQVVRVIEPIAKGEELTHSYVDICQPVTERQDYLRSTYDFKCNCKKCQIEPRGTVVNRRTAIDTPRVQQLYRSNDYEGAIEEARRHVPEDHMDMQELHASAMNYYMETGNFAQAVTFAQWLMKQYTDKYPEFHPLVGLHAYTLGDLKRMSGDETCIEDYRAAAKILRVTHTGAILKELSALINEQKLKN